jgi:hypothetical protein
MAFDTTDYGWFNKGSGGSSSPSGSGGFPDYSDIFKPNSPIQADTWKTGFGVGENKGKSFLDKFAEGLQSTGKDKYQQQATQSGFQTGGGDKSPGANVGQIGPDAFIYTPPTAYSPFTVQGVQGSKSGVGGALGTLAGIGASFIPGLGPGIKAALPSIGGTVGGMFG